MTPHVAREPFKRTRAAATVLCSPRVIAALVFGCAAGCASLPPGAVRQIEAAHEAYMTHRYDQVERLLDPVITQHPDKPQTAEALYLRGLCRLQTGQRSKALGDLEAALDRSRREDLTALIHAQLGNVAFEDGQYDRAAQHYRKAEPGLPEKPPTDRVLYQYGLSLLRSGRFQEGRAVLTDVFTDYAGSEYATQARRAFGWRQDYFTVQCGAFTSIATAHETAARLREKGFEALAVPEVRNGRKLFLVQAGKHPTYAAAVNAAAAIRTVIPDAFIVP